MAKEIDLNGFWKIEDNPISKEGVFPYLGKQISPELEPDKIYMVYRPASELTSEETIESFNGVPFIDEHEMLGEGFTKYDDRPAGGVLFNVKANGGILTGDFKIYSEELQEEISNGKKELSLGYLCDYELTKGVWNGQRYDAIQKNIRGNHVALVNHGRMGSDVRVYDKAITMDALDITQEISAGAGSPNESRADGSLIEPHQQGESKMKYVSLEEVKAVLKTAFSWGDGETDPKEKLVAELLDEKAVEGIIPTGDESPDDKEKGEDEDVDKREAIRKIMAIAAKPDSDFDGGENEKIETIAKLLENSEYAKSDKGTANDEDPDEEKKKSEAKDKCGKDEDDADKDKDKKSGEDEDPDEKDKKDSEDEEESKEENAKKAMDAMPKQVLKMIARRNEIVKAVEPLIGTFACDEMTPKDAAVYACKKLGLQATEDEAEPVLRGFLAAQAKNNKVYGLDSAVSGNNSGMDKATQKYLKGE